MRKPKENEIPTTTLKYNTIYADLDTPEGRGTILFFDTKCIVVGLQGKPNMLVSTPGFVEDILPDDVKEDIYEVKQLVLQPTFFYEPDEEIAHCLIPDWLVNFRNVERLFLQNVDIENLEILNNLPIESLQIENIKYENSGNLIAAIKQFKRLKIVTYDESLYADVRVSMQRLNLQLIPIEKHQKDND